MGPVLSFEKMDGDADLMDLHGKATSAWPSAQGQGESPVVRDPGHAKKPHARNRETSIAPADSAGRTAKAQSDKAGILAVEESDRGDEPAEQRGARPGWAVPHATGTERATRVPRAERVCAERRGKENESGSPVYCTISMSIC